MCTYEYIYIYRYTSHIAAQNRLFYMRFFVNTDRWIAERRLYIIALCTLSIKPIKMRTILIAGGVQYLQVYTRPIPKATVSIKFAPFNRGMLIVFCVKRFAKLSNGRATAGALYHRAPRRARLSRQAARLTRNNDAAFQSRYFAGSVCGRDGNARINSRRVPLMCQEQTFPESSIYAGTPGMQMKRVVLRRSLPRRGTITAELLTKLN